MSENSVVLKVMMPGAQHFTSLDVPSEVVNLRTLRSHLSEAGHTNVSDAVTYVGETQALDEAKSFTDYENADGTLYITFVNENKTGGLVRYYQELLSI
tara:strand:+ start:856 stop:1149 length:294 start_codon:yes stop_codon:yes gene_type:complete